MKVGDRVVCIKDFKIGGHDISIGFCGTIKQINEKLEYSIGIKLDSLDYFIWLTHDLKYWSFSSSPNMALYSDVVKKNKRYKYQWVYMDKSDMYHITNQRYETEEEARATLLPTDKILRSIKKSRMEIL